MDLSLDWYFGPDDVNFYALEAGETGTEGQAKGWFAKLENGNTYTTRSYHDAWIGNEVLRRPPMPVQINKDNNGLLSKIVVKGKGTKCLNPDHATAGATQPPAIDSTGRFEWPIKWKWRLKGHDGPGTPFAPATQWLEIIPGSTDTGSSVIPLQVKGGKGNVTVP